jgi:hypothetical protein
MKFFQQKCEIWLASVAILPIERRTMRSIWSVCDCLATRPALHWRNSKDPIMSDKATLRLERGTKRTCQNADCGERFYDLNRDPITCPICNSMYAIALQPPPQVPARPTPRPLKRPVPIPHEVKEQIPAAEDGEELAALESEDEATPAEEDDTFLEEVEEDSSNMSGIVDAPAPGDDDK